MNQKTVGLSRLAALLLLALAASAFQRSATTKRPVLLPVDQAQSDSGLLRVRNAILDALRAPDFTRAMTFVADDVIYRSEKGINKPVVKNSLGISVGKGTLAEEVIRALELGGSFTTTRGTAKGERQFCAPYVYSAFPLGFDRLEPREDFPWVIIAKNVPLRDAPGAQARVIGRLSYDLVYTAPGGTVQDSSGAEWMRLDGPNGLKGFVPPETVRDPEDYHVCFAHRKNGWQVVDISRKEFPTLKDLP